jgi:hypothetical protein
MSSDVVYYCATCSKTVKGKQHYAICGSCSRRVHRKCYSVGLSHNQWTTIRQSFTCSACEASSRLQRFTSNYCDGERQLDIDEPKGKTHHVSTSVPPTTNKYEIIIGASQKGGDVVIDGCGYTYNFHRDYPGLRVWMCTFRGCVKFSRCNTTLKQVKGTSIDFIRTYSQEDFTLERAHRHPPNYQIEKRRLTVGQLGSTANEP